jgi:hypothetical protein
MSVTPLRAVPGTHALPAESAMGSFDGHTIFRRTTIGLEESRRRDSELPQRLKTLLLLIDGRTPVERFVKALTVYGDVTEVFQVLLDLGYIESIQTQDSAPTDLRQFASRAEPVRAASSRATSGAVHVGPPAFAAYVAPDQRSSLAASATIVPMGERQGEYEPTAFDYGLPKHAQATQSSTPSRHMSSAGNASFSSAPPSTAQSDMHFKRALNQLNDWMPDLFGADSMEVMLELEKCADRSQLVETIEDLRGSMVKAWGEKETHNRLDRLKNTLAGQA